MHCNSKYRKVLLAALPPAETLSRAECLCCEEVYGIPLISGFDSSPRDPPAERGRSETMGKSAMPIDYYIDHARRLVVARGRGVFADAEVFAYQREVWSRSEVAGYDELVDMTEVVEIAAPSPAGPRIEQLAGVAAAQDNPTSAGKFAIVAPGSLAFGLGREYQIYRELDLRSKKQVGVFRTLVEALSFLGIDSLENLEPRRSSHCT
jgi:hypothetical protein